jgi:hypothetical protein
MDLGMTAAALESNSDNSLAPYGDELYEWIPQPFEQWGTSNDQSLHQKNLSLIGGGARRLEKVWP